MVRFDPVVSALLDANKHPLRREIDQADTLGPEEVALKPTREDDLPGAPVANWLLGGKSIDEEGSALGAGVRKLVDSRYLVHDKQQKRMRPVRYGDIALLAASHERVKTWVVALSAQGIPVATVATAGTRRTITPALVAKVTAPDEHPATCRPSGVNASAST